MANKNLLERHRIEFHSENKPHKCQHCDLSFRWVNQLNYHIKSHENDLVECQICGKNMDSRSRMDHHLDYEHFKDKRRRGGVKAFDRLIFLMHSLILL